jgi:hypothetical protein
VTNLAPGAFSGQLSNGKASGSCPGRREHQHCVYEVTYNNAAPWPVAAAGLGSSLVLLNPLASPTNPANWGASAEVHGSPGWARRALFVHDLVINEVLAHTDPPQEDAVELLNLTTNTVDLGGWFLSDDDVERKKYRFPTNTLVPAGGYLVVYQEQLTNSAGALIPFSISSKGDDVFLSQGNANGDLVRFVDEVAFDATRNGVSVGRYPNGTGEVIPLLAPTFGVNAPSSLEDFRTGTGAPNAGPWVGPVVINEILYHPSTAAVPPRLEAEFIELLNTSASPVPLYNVEYPELAWSLSGGISYVFPTNLTLAPGEHLVITGTNDVEAFRASWGIATNVIVLGPWSNSLNNGGDTIRLRVPNSPEPPSNLAARYVMDEVTYNDQLPWPLAADGLGGSLERTDPTAWGDTPDNWHSAPNVATPGTTNTAYLPPGSIVISEVMAVNRHTLTDEDGDYSDWIELYNTRPYDISLRGWYLTDQSAMPTQWTFPEVTIPANGYLVVFASAKHRTNDATHLHTSFSLDAAGEYLALFRPDLVREFAFDPAFPPQAADISYGYADFGNRQETPVQAGTRGTYRVPTNAAALATNWMDITFDEAGWLPATNGLGYDTETTYAALIATDLRASMYNKQSSFFARFPFVVSNAAGIAQMDLALKFEDGFVAWLNGMPVRSNNAPAATAWNATATATRDDSLALVFTNYDLSSSTFLLQEGINVLAFQGLNTGTNSSDLLLLPVLQLVWAGGATSVTGHALGYLSPPSPAGYNGPGLPAVVPAPALSHPGGVFVGDLAVTVTCADVTAELRYTQDGSDPTPASPLYTGPLAITNDTELIVRAFVAGQVPSPTTGAAYRRSFLGINEFLASNATASPEIHDFAGYSDFIELYNAGSNAIDLAGYHLSDSAEQPFKWQFPAGAVIPAGGHFLVWADGFDGQPGQIYNRPYWNYWAYTTLYYHATFKLSADTEAVALFTPSGSRIDAVSYGPQSVDISQGRYPDGASAWGFFGEPTAGASNRTPALTHNLYLAPDVTIAAAESGLVVTGAVEVTLSADPPATEIRFTTNGAIPNSSSLLYTQALNLATSAVVRARAFAPDRHPGPVATRTFLRNPPAADLPRLTFAIDPKLLYDPAIGVYSNLYKEREVPGHIQLWLTPSQTAFQVNAGFRIYGLNTFLFAQKPFTVYLDSKFGDEAVAYPLFPEKPIGFYDRFLLRNGNDDWPTTFFRDTLGQTLVKGVIDNATQGYQPCASYLNGAYYGLINIQEKMDEMYCAKNYGVALADIDFFENDGFTSEELLNAGTPDAWYTLLNFITTNNLANPTNFAWVESQVDLEDLVDYVAAQTFVVDTSWTHNRKWWRERNGDGRWRWCLVDFDRGLTYANVSNNIVSSLGSSMVVYRECLANPGFRAFAAQRLLAHLNSSFATNRVLPIVDREALRVRGELTNHIAQYSTQGGISSLATWDTRVETIRTYCRQRPALARQFVLNYFATGQAARVAVDVTGGDGQVLANHVPLLNGLTNTFAAGLPLHFTARPAIGQQFVRWEVVSNLTETLLATGSVWRYFDSVTNEIPGWAAAGFDDSGWASGPGQLGYGDGDEATTVSFGPDSTNVYVTTYFRAEVVITNPLAFTTLQLGLLRDDGAAVYLNGQELLRSNLPTGALAITTLASISVGGSTESVYVAYAVAPTNFVPGTNLLAVEVHQQSISSSDLSFDLKLEGLRAEVQEIPDSPDLDWTPRDGESVRAVFAPAGVSLLPTVLTNDLVLAAAGSPYYATGDIFVPSNTTFEAGPGVDILLPDAADFRVQGRLRLLGVSNSPVRLLPNTNANARARAFVDPALAAPGDLTPYWGGLSFEHATHTGELFHVTVRGATVSQHDPVNHRAAISGLGSDLWMDGLDVDDVQQPIFVQEGNSTILENSRLHIAFIGDAINVKRALYARIENCDLSGDTTIDTDAIDYDGLQGGIIRGNLLHDFMGENNDAIDIGEEAVGILIESNLILRCQDKAVSIGQASTAYVRRNIVRDTTLGIGIKDAGSHGWIDYNVFHQTQTGVAVYEKNRGDGGGHAEVRGCLFSENALEPVTADALSTAEVTYCLSDTLPLAGVGNVNAQPQFLNPANLNFALQVGSAAVDAGPPGDPADPDGTRADMGPLPFDWRDGHAVISEIHYHPVTAGQAEYVELYNPGGATQDLAGFRFNKGFVFTFPAGVALAPESYLVVAASANGLAGVTSLVVWATGTLDNAGEVIELQDPASNEIDRVSYGRFDPWPATPDGLGPSLSLINPRRDNAQPENWYASGATNGTPGAAFDQHLPGALLVTRATGTVMTVNFAALTGLLYLLEYTPDLTAPNWQVVDSGTRGLDGRVTVEHAPTSPTPAGCYRIRVESP